MIRLYEPMNQSQRLFPARRYQLRSGWLETDLFIPSYVTTLSNKFSYATNKGDAVKSQS